MSICKYLEELLGSKVTGVDISYNENPQFNIKRAIVACFTEKEIKSLVCDGMELKSSKFYEGMNAYRTVILLEPPSNAGYYMCIKLSTCLFN